MDFACKEWEQAGQKWALRNVKLRISRKLIFVAGLLVVFNFYDNADLQEELARHVGAGVPAVAVEHLRSCTAMPPLDIVCETFLRLGLTEAAGNLLDAYDVFLSKLNDPEVREQLEEAVPREAYADFTFLELREVSHEFQDVLTKVFFDDDTSLRAFNRKYGVF